MGLLNRARADPLSMGGRTGAWILGGLLLALLGIRAASIHTESINWDEFALLNSAAHTAETGELHGGGRPGLAVLLLQPFVDGCADEIAVARNARWLWLAIGGVFLLGLGVLLYQLGPQGPGRRATAGLGVALLALTPAYLQWSLQVRTDSLALACGIWASVALIASRQRPVLALLAGLLFGMGYLASQKLLYLGALAVVLLAGEGWLRGMLRPRRDAARILACAGAMFVAVAVYPNLLTVDYHGPALLPGARALEHVLKPTLNTFEFYRQSLGFSQFAQLLPGLIPHAVLLVGLLFATFFPPGASDSRRRLAIAWAILLLGCAVLWFHAGRFFYFWMTLGIFPAVALACAYPALRECARDRFSPAVGRALHVALWGILLVQSVGALSITLIDTQAVQRESLAFVARNFDRSDAGFHPESALFCRRDPRPFPTYFSQHIFFEFGGEERAQNVSRMVERFREKPVKYVVDSFRLEQFPNELKRFWSENYHPYSESIRVAGRWLEVDPGPALRFDLIAGGTYRWLPVENPTPLWVDGRALAPGATRVLEAGTHESAARDGPAHGLLVLALEEPPKLPFRPFYRTYP